MGMAINHDVGIVPDGEQCRRGTAHLVTVADVDTSPLDAHQDLFGELGFTGRIRVAEDGPDGRDQPKLLQNHRASDVSGVEDQLYARQSFVHSRSQESVSIGNESEY